MYPLLSTATTTIQPTHQSLSVDHCHNLLSDLPASSHDFLHRTHRYGLTNKSHHVKSFRINPSSYKKIYSHCLIWSLSPSLVPLISHRSPLVSALHCIRLSVSGPCRSRFRLLFSLLPCNVLSSISPPSTSPPSHARAHTHTHVLQG